MSLIWVFPGQGSQRVGMGEGLFRRFPELIEQADRQLGYSVEELCLRDTQGRLTQTEFTQPTLYVVNALTHLAKVADSGRKPDFVAGHSLGEYTALMAAGAFDFLTGLRLVQKRGELMGRVRGGAMAAIIGMKPDRIPEILFNFAFDAIDVANYNSPGQTVISGPEQDISEVVPIFKEAGATVFPLKVSGAFHSRMMQPVQKEFGEFLDTVSFGKLEIPVIANVLGAPYEEGRAKAILGMQLTSPVRWTQSVQYLLSQPDPHFTEVGPGTVLTGLIKQIQAG